MKKNAENACTAFIDILRKIKGVTYKKVDRPDEKNRKAPDVDFILAPTDENRKFPRIAVEHTIIEAHEGQKDYVNRLDDIGREIDQRCRGRLSIEYCFTLSTPPSLIVRMKKKDREQFVEEMSCWIPEAAKSLTTDQQSSQLYNGHKISLWCVGSCSGLNGTIGMTSTRLGNAKKQRQGRFRRAIEEKLPKLIKYKEEGFATALLLEDVSAVYTNPRDNSKYLMSHQYLSEFQSKIDYVIIFVSQGEKMFLGLVWKEESQLYSEIPDNRRFDQFSFQQ